MIGQRVRRIREDRHVRADLPFALDLLAATMRAGASPEAAAREVAGVLDGPMAPRLARTARALRLGTPVAEAWEALGPLVGVPQVAQAAARTQHSGAAFANALCRVAAELRAGRLARAEATARRAGVLIVLPLGLCFLPAFVLTGLVPIIVAVLGNVLSI